jgi:transposase
MKRVRFVGEKQEIFLPQHCSLILLMSPVAHLGKKRSTMWTGYKIHLSETCEEDLPHLITHVVTTAAPRTDEAMTESIHAGMQQADVLPGRHVMDSGYVSSQMLVTSQKRIAG